MDRRHGSCRADRPERESGPPHGLRRKETSRRLEEREVPVPASSRRPMESGSIVVLIPVFNDWASLARLLPRLDAVLAAHDRKADVLVVDDGSTMEPEEDLEPEDISIETGMPLATVRSHLQRGLKLLREKAQRTLKEYSRG